MLLPCTINIVAPSMAIAFQICWPSRCQGIETLATSAPRRLNAWADSRTLVSTSGSDSPSQPKPSVTIPNRRPFTSPDSAWLYASPLNPAFWRGSSPSGPAKTSKNKARSATVRAIGPVWSTVISMGKAPVYGTNPYVGLSPQMPHQLLGIRIDPP